MNKFAIIALCFLAACSHRPTQVRHPERSGSVLVAEMYQDPSIEDRTLGEKLPPIAYYNYSDEIGPKQKAVYSFYGNACIKGVTYSELAESKQNLKDTSDNLKWKTFSTYHFNIHNYLINEKDEVCEDIYKEDRLLHTLEIPVSESKSFVNIFAPPEIEIRRIK